MPSPSRIRHAASWSRTTARSSQQTQESFRERWTMQLRSVCGWLTFLLRWRVVQSEEAANCLQARDWSGCADPGCTLVFLFVYFSWMIPMFFIFGLFLGLRVWECKRISFFYAPRLCIGSVWCQTCWVVVTIHASPILTLILILLAT